MSLGAVCQLAGTVMIAGAAIFWLATACALALGLRRLKSLADVTPWPDGALPSLTIIAAAKDEADRIERAVRSFLAQDYPGLQLIVVDDRSVDGTGAILDRMARGTPGLRVIHVDALPQGWIGKCNALARASAAAKTEWLLFTDGDIEFAPDAVRRAASLALEQKLDHLAVAPDMILDSLGEALFVGYFLAMFYLSQRPWRAPDPRARSSIGIGAFNLVRREAYERSGGHERIRYELVDDLGLGKILKRSGARQMLALHGGAVRAKWQVGVRGLIRGVEKNAFAALRYRTGVALPAVASQVVVALAPVAGLFLPGPAPKAAAAAAWVGVALVYAVTSRGARIRPWHAILMPVGGILFSFAIFRSIALAVARGGLFWRGTFYPLAELRRGMLP
jgi:glycosyl transferase family 2